MIHSEALFKRIPPIMEEWVTFNIGTKKRYIIAGIIMKKQIIYDIKQ